MNNVFLILGGNLGERRKNLAKAVTEIGKAGAIVKRHSHVYETEPWGIKDQPNYYNQVVEVLTNQHAEALMQTLLEVEKKMGRIRAEKYGARIIDIDILFFNDEIIGNDTVTIPHPKLQDRRFVLEPLAEIAPEFVHPRLRKTIAELLQKCTDDCTVNKLPDGL